MSDVLSDDLAQDIFPIFLAAVRPEPRIVSFQGTGFLLGPKLLVTCWHVVDCEISESQALVIAHQRDGTNAYRLEPLLDIAQDMNGRDLAIARVMLEPKCRLEIAEQGAPMGTDVFSFGYPLTEKRLSGADIRFRLHPRYLQGYVVRSFMHELTHFGPTPAYEVDIPAPAGLSGAPLIKRGSREVLGVVYGTHDVSRTEEVASIDPETGAKHPEVQRIVSFCVAHLTSSVLGLSHPKWEGKQLRDFIVKPDTPASNDGTDGPSNDMAGDEAR